MDKTTFKAVVVGAGVAGRELLQELRKISKRLKILGFIDDDFVLQCKKINNLPYQSNITLLKDGILCDGNICILQHYNN